MNWNIVLLELGMEIAVNNNGNEIFHPITNVGARLFPVLLYPYYTKNRACNK